VPIDWDALEDAFENNAPEVHSYLHVPTGDVLRIVDGIADPQMHARIAADPNYLRIEPVSSREQYRWMERYIPMVEDPTLQSRLTRAIDGKGAFRRFKDVLMSYGPERERWFAFRSERLRIFMEAWLNAHALNPVKRPMWVPDLIVEDQPPAPSQEREAAVVRGSEALRRQLHDIIEALGARDLETLAALGEFLRSRRGGRAKAAPSSRGGPRSAPRSSASAEAPEGSTAAEPAKAEQPAEPRTDPPSGRKAVSRESAVS